MNDAIYITLTLIFVSLTSIGFTILFILWKISDLLNKLVSASVPEETREISRKACEELGGVVKDGRCVVIVKGDDGERIINIGEIVDEVKT